MPPHHLASCWAPLSSKISPSLLHPTHPLLVHPGGLSMGSSPGRGIPVLSPWKDPSQTPPRPSLLSTREPLTDVNHSPNFPATAAPPKRVIQDPCHVQEPQLREGTMTALSAPLSCGCIVPGREMPGNNRLLLGFVAGLRAGGTAGIFPRGLRLCGEDPHLFSWL